MIKKLIGLLVAVAVIGVIVMAILRWGEYRSMLSFDTQTSTAAEFPEEPAVLPPMPVPTETLAPNEADVEDGMPADSLG